MSMASESVALRSRDSHWVVQRHLPTFRIPNDQEMSGGDGKQWLVDVNILISYYSYILTVSFDRFWAEVFKQVEKNVLGWQFDDQHQFTSSNSDTLAIVSRTIDYIIDAGKSLGVFLTFLGPVNPSVAELCIKQDVVSSLANFYCTTIVTIRDHILRSITWSTEKKTGLLSKLAIAAAAIVRVVRVGLVEPGLVHRIMQISVDAPDPDSNQSLMGAINTLVGVMMDMLNYPQFATAYVRLYAVEDDIVLIQENSNFVNLDRDQVDYLRNAFSRLTKESSAQSVSSDGAEGVVPPPVEEMLRGTTDEEPQPGSSRPPDFLTVKAFLPTVNDDLIERCLEHCNNDPQSAITALLDGWVPSEVNGPDSVNRPMTRHEPGQIWQGKRRNDATIQPLSKEDKERTSQLAVSVWDDNDSAVENGSESEDGERDAAGPLKKCQTDLTYDDEYDDTYDVEVGTKLEPLDEEEAEDAELGGVSNQLRELSCHASPAHAEPRVDRGKHRYRQVELPDQEPRKNVLQIENPEVVRLRRQQAAANRVLYVKALD
ncbi:unnamed protein product [Hydatigera taeniaeformis]|uniref:CUE domain-containing protein n=1 Tax=Hydatigena taeniaeformis TaxID=6205 RepID=A0A0R3WZS9_HYDTA|nr:unnamed protein product [Hydatigera taeniaeformis]